MDSVWYLGFQKEGGPNVRWTLVLTQRGRGNQVFQFFYYVKQNFLAKGAWSIRPMAK